MRKVILVIVAIGVLGILVAPSLAQQTQYPMPSQSPMPSQPPAAQRDQSVQPGEHGGPTSMIKTIDCPPTALKQETQQAPRGAVGTPQGAGTGSGLNAMPSVGPSKQLEGTIKTIGSTRTNRILEVGDLKLEVEPTTVVLVNCQQASVAQLKEGSKIKAAYEVKEPNRNVATVIEAQQ